MSDTSSDSYPVKSYVGGSKVALVNLVLSSIILLILLFRFLGHHHHHHFGPWHHGYGGGPAYGYHQPFAGGPGFGGLDRAR